MRGNEQGRSYMGLETQKEEDRRRKKTGGGENPAGGGAQGHKNPTKTQFQDLVIKCRIQRFGQ